MYLTPIIYPISLLEGHTFVLRIVELNPITHYVEYFRGLVMYNHIPGVKENLICVGMSLAMFFIGAFVFKKAQGKFILHI